MLPQIIQFIVKQSKQITPTVLHLALERSDNKPFNFIPGQFITVHFEHENKTIRRSYSVATIPGQTELTEIAVSYVEHGLGTQYLFGLKLEEEVSITGPFGRLILGNEKPQRYLLIATGTGVTPYRSMLPELEKRLNEQANLEIIVMQGVRTPIDLLYGDDFVELMQRNSRFKFYACYSREMPANPQDYEQSGYVTALIRKLNVQPQNDMVYLCGNPNMIDEIFTYLKQQEFNTESIRREKYISPVTKK